jgi:hypothetical protein
VTIRGRPARHSRPMRAVVSISPARRPRVAAIKKSIRWGCSGPRRVGARTRLARPARRGTLAQPSRGRSPRRPTVPSSRPPRSAGGRLRQACASRRCATTVFSEHFTNRHRPAGIRCSSCLAVRAEACRRRSDLPVASHLMATRYSRWRISELPGCRALSRTSRSSTSRPRCSGCRRSRRWILHGSAFSGCRAGPSWRCSWAPFILASARSLRTCPAT